MQPLNNCLVLLTGHNGECDLQKVINMNPFDYKVVFPIPLKDPLTDGHHNLLLKSFSANVQETYARLSDLATTTTAHKDNIPAQPGSIDLTEQHCQYVNEHYLTSRSGNQTNYALSLDEIAPERYKAYLLNSSESWSGHVEVILDQGQILRDLNKITETEGYQYDKKDCQVKLSPETCLQIRILEKKPFDKVGISFIENPFHQVVISLSKFLDSIVPNIRIPFIYHADSKMIEIIPCLYLNDGDANFKPERVCQGFLGGLRKAKATDFYYEAVIPSDAYLIWDASRNEMKFKLLGSRSDCQHQKGPFKNYI